MKFTVEQKELFAIVKVESDHLVASIIEAEVLSLSEKGFRNINIDFTGVNTIDSLEVKIITQINQLCLANKGILVLTGLEQNLKETFSTSELESLIILPTMEEASEYIMMEELTRQITGNG